MEIVPRGWWSILWIAACGIVGFALGRAGDRTAKHRFSEPGPQALHPSRSTSEGLENFMALLSGTPPKAAIWKTVSRIPIPRIPQALKRLGEAREHALNGFDSDQLDDIATALYFHWAQSDPQAALADALAHRRAFWVESVLAAWMNTDPDAAYAAVRKDKDFEFAGRTMLVHMWKPDNVFENLERHRDKHRDLLGWYCIASVDDEDQRNTTLSALKKRPDLKDRDWAYQLLFRAWGYQDFTSAITEARRQEIPWLETQLLRDNFRNQPEVAMPWAAGHGIAADGPVWEEGYSKWLESSQPQAARDWFAGVSPTWLAEGRFAAVAGLLARDLDRSENSKDSIHRDHAARQLAQVMATWKTTDPDAADKWLVTAPLPAREYLTTEKGADHE